MAVYNMDKLTLKSTILELRDSGFTFEEISNTLKEEYNITMSRQAVHGMYNRTVASDNSNRQKNIILSTSDILNYYCLGITEDKIKGLLEFDMKVADIKRVILENPDNITCIRKTQINRIITSIINGADINDIKKSLAYKCISIEDKVFNKLIEKASETYIRESVALNILSIYNMSNDRQLTKKLIDKFNINMNISELGKYQRGNKNTSILEDIKIQEPKEGLLGVTINNQLIKNKV